MKREEFIKIIEKYIDLNEYDIKFKKSPYYENENEIWLYRKDDTGHSKRFISGYKFNGIIYKTKKELQHNFIAGIPSYYQKIYDYKNQRMGLLVKEEDLKDEEYLKLALCG